MTNVPKLAFMFLTYGLPLRHKIWQSYIQEDRANIYIHPKNKDVCMQNIFYKKYIIPKTVKTNWGGLSLVQATLNLIEQALEDEDNSHFILLSDSCLPIMSFFELYGKISNMHKSLIIQKDAKPGESHHLIECNKVKREHYCKQSQWMILTRDNAQFIIDHNHLNQFKKCNIPDEKYFSTLFRAYSIDIVNCPSTFVFWKKDYLCESLSNTFKKEIYYSFTKSMKNMLKNGKVNQLKKKLFSGHPAVLMHMNANICNEVQDIGCLFIRKVNQQTKIDKSYYNKIKVITTINTIPKLIHVPTPAFKPNNVINRRLRLKTKQRHYRRNVIRKKKIVHD